MKGDVVAHVAQASRGGRVHFLERTGNVLAVAPAKEIQRGVVGAHLAFIEHKNLFNIGRELLYRDFFSLEGGILGGGFRHKLFLASYKREHAEREKHQGFFHE